MEDVGVGEENDVTKWEIHVRVRGQSGMRAPSG